MICLFCNRGIPTIPSYLRGSAAVVHTDKNGLPCLQGASQETQAESLAEFPHEELLDSDEHWDDDLAGSTRIPKPTDNVSVPDPAAQEPTVQPTKTQRSPRAIRKIHKPKS